MRNLQKVRRKQIKETRIPHEKPSRPREKVGTDLFEFKNKNYLITVDFYSNLWEVDKLPDTSRQLGFLSLLCLFEIFVSFSLCGMPEK